MVPFVYSCHPCTRVAKESTANSQVTRAFPVLDAMIPLHHHHHPLRPQYTLFRFPLTRTQYTLFRFPLTRTGTFQRDEKTQTFKKKKGLLIPIRRTQKKKDQDALLALLIQSTWTLSPSSSKLAVLHADLYRSCS